jgi:hypothetical protein
MTVSHVGWRNLQPHPVFVQARNTAQHASASTPGQRGARAGQ